MAKHNNDTTNDTTNEVRLFGRLAAAPQERELPSGDLLCTARLIVPRPIARVLPSGRKGPTVDVLDLAAWGGRQRAGLARLAEGDTVEVTGALRRRFFKTGAGTASRVEVEVSSVRKARARSSG